MSSSSSGTPAGWYSDANDSTRLRYWDGTAWTNHFSPTIGTAPAPTSHTPQPIPAPTPFTAERQQMGDPVPTSAARQPGPDIGGPKDGDGSRRTVDTQPPTAPAPSSRRLWILLIVGGVLVVLVCAWVFFSTGLAVLLTIIALVGGSAYAMRNERIRRVVVRLGGLAFAGLAAAVAASQKKADEARQLQEEERRKAELKEQRKEQDRAALKAAFLSRIAPAKRNDAAVAAQINAISNPETAKALQNLQNLLYTHVITEAEFQTAKDRLLGPQ